MLRWGSHVDDGWLWRWRRRERWETLSIPRDLFLSLTRERSFLWTNSARNSTMTFLMCWQKLLVSKRKPRFVELSGLHFEDKPVYWKPCRDRDAEYGSERHARHSQSPSGSGWGSLLLCQFLNKHLNLSFPISLAPFPFPDEIDEIIRNSLALFRIRDLYLAHLLALLFPIPSLPEYPPVLFPIYSSMDSSALVPSPSLTPTVLPFPWPPLFIALWPFPSLNQDANLSFICTIYCRLIGARIIQSEWRLGKSRLIEIPVQSCEQYSW